MPSLTVYAFDICSRMLKQTRQIERIQKENNCEKNNFFSGAFAGLSMEVQVYYHNLTQHNTELFLWTVSDVLVDVSDFSTTCLSQNLEM